MKTSIHGKNGKSLGMFSVPFDRAAARKAAASGPYTGPERAAAEAIEARLKQENPALLIQLRHDISESLKGLDKVRAAQVRLKILQTGAANSVVQASPAPAA